MKYSSRPSLFCAIVPCCRSSIVPALLTDLRTPANKRREAAWCLPRQAVTKDAIHQPWPRRAWRGVGRRTGKGVVVFGAIRTPQVVTGAEQLRDEGFARLRGRRVGLLTNPTGITADRISLVDQLAAADESRWPRSSGRSMGYWHSRRTGRRSARDDTRVSTSWSTASTGSVKHRPRRASPGSTCGPIDIQAAGVHSFTYVSTVALLLPAAPVRVARCMPRRHCALQRWARLPFRGTAPWLPGTR